ncbi:hypothetical protein V3Q90_01315 [Flavobacterium oreochromis]|uniref:Uncharacterized protein n=1 Tax=Flavobacterium oreochromis TaxID=2906078 RepID=A0ABW8P7S1_9FLAO|nr:hypothetical protein [Flavobacterium oreochromis]OWP76062.1 hypothetical protein BWG23_09195 [Flavobacterium oreochromis]
MIRHPKNITDAISHYKNHNILLDQFNDFILECAVDMDANLVCTYKNIPVVAFFTTEFKSF